VLLILAFFPNWNTYIFSQTSSTIIEDKDTDYNRLIIYDNFERETGRPIRIITNNIEIAQSGMYIDNPSELLFEYTKMFNLLQHFKPDFKNTVLIGAGGYSYPKYFQKKYPDKILDVVEIDPGFTELSKQYLNFEESERVRIVHKDGRIFLNKTEHTYDTMIIDAFPSHFAIPFHLTTQEAVKNIYRILSDDGVVMVNIISSISGDRSKFLQAEYRTYKDIFPHVLLFQVRQINPEAAQNILLVALKSPETPSFENSDKTMQSYLELLWKDSYNPTLPPLTDNFAPVEKYIEYLY